MDTLLIIDIQQAYFVEKKQYDADGVIARINTLANRVRLNHGRVIFIQHDGDGAELAAPFTPGWEIFSELIVGESDMAIRKTLNDAFVYTELNQNLLDLKTDRLLITGWATDHCVHATVQGAVNHGFNAVVLEDCHTLTDRPHLKATQVIEHHHYLWRNMICREGSVTVIPSTSY